jgi:thiol-disulfide isomerase/thioredoxin
MQSVMRAAAMAALFVSAGLSAYGQATARPVTLKAGDSAPPIKVDQWIKGKPVADLNKGIYVIEFWATWCGPCRTSIPHITELAKKYQGKVSVAGISVWEQDPSNVKHVKDFVNEMGDKMDYSVALDGSAAVMADTWMKAAGQNGIPAAFIVKDGKIQWIGHPMAMDKPLEQVVAGTFDLKKQAEEDAARNAMQNELAAAVQAMQKGDHKKALEIVDKVLAKQPSMEPQLGAFKFDIMATMGDPAAAQYGLKLSEKHYWDQPMQLNQIAWGLVDDENKFKTKPDYKIAIKIAKRACDLTKDQDPMILDTLAYAHFKNGDVSKAIEIQERAVALLVSGGEIDEETKKEIRDRLEMFKKAAKKG